MTPLSSADDFHAAIRQFRAIQACRNILEFRHPLDLNPDFVMHLLQGLRRNVDSVPAAIRVDFTSVVDDLIRVAQPGVRLTSAAITNALGTIYQDTTASDDSSVDSAFFASAPLPILRPYRDLRSSTDSRRSSSDTAMQSFVPFPGSVESAFTARQDVCPDSRPDPRHYRSYLMGGISYW